MTLLHQSEEIIAQRYRIINILGEGGMGITYQAEDLNSGERVALKALSIHRMTDWKKMELFEREAQILSGLNHPSIPRYLDYFQVNTPENLSFYIAQQLAPGKSLAELIENGWQPHENEVRSLAIKLLEILVYLQSLIPAVIHRDIKPQNIILDSDGELFLVDFGAVRDTYHHTITGGSTIVGTFGYMAPEQFRGKAELSTDLYGLGATLLFLLTGKSPADLPQRQLKIDFRPYVEISDEFADWLEKMLEPTILSGSVNNASSHRFASAKEALAVLQGEQALSYNYAEQLCQSQKNRITIIKSQKKLIVEIKPLWLQEKRWKFISSLTKITKRILPLLLVLIFPSFILGAIALPVTDIFFPISLNLPPLHVFIQTLLNRIFLSFNLLIWAGIIFVGFFVGIGLWMVGNLVIRATSRTWLEINRDNFSIQQYFLGFCYRNVRGVTENIKVVKIGCIRLLFNKISLTFCTLILKNYQHYFGLKLTKAEQKWLIGEIGTFLEKLDENLKSSSE